MKIESACWTDCKKRGKYWNRWKRLLETRKIIKHIIRKKENCKNLDGLRFVILSLPSSDNTLKFEQAASHRKAFHRSVVKNCFRSRLSLNKNLTLNKRFLLSFCQQDTQGCSWQCSSNPLDNQIYWRQVPLW